MHYAFKIREAGIACEILQGNNVGKRLQKADKMGMIAALMVGEDELKSSAITIKNLQNSEQKTLPLEAWIDEVKSNVA
jgi:histidyl-tRNA synthetase